MHLIKNRLTTTFLAALAMLISACSSYDSRLADRRTMYLGQAGDVWFGGEFQNRPMDNVSYWDGDHVSGAPRIRIHLGEQRAYFYKGGQLVGVSEVSTGREGHGTPAGDYKVINKSRDHISNAWGNFVDRDGNVVVSAVSVKRDTPPPGTHFEGSPMPYFVRLTNTGIGLHAGFLPGYPASAGCIRMPEHMARHFFHNVSPGTPVPITY